MNETQTPPIIPDAQTGEGGEIPKIVGLKIFIADLPGLFPPGNLIGTYNLLAAVRSELQCVGVLDGGWGTGGGPLNHCQLLFAVSAEAPALAAIDRILEAGYLRHFATIFKYHHGEGCFLPVGPDNANISFCLSISDLRALMIKDDAIMKSYYAAAAFLAAHRANIAANKLPPQGDPPGPITKS